MKTAKKVLSMVFALGIFASVFTGCGKETLPDGVVSLSKAKVGDKIVLGSYEQDNNNENGKEAITWFVLAVEGKKLLLVSEKVLDTKKYNDKKVAITWENSTIRTWLNSDFMKEAFTKKESNKVVETTLKNSDNPKYKTPGGKETQDKVFLLSLEEADKYFDAEEFRAAQLKEEARLAEKASSKEKPRPDDKPPTKEQLRSAMGTKFAEKNGLKLGKDINNKGTGMWLLRTPGDKSINVCYVNNDGRDWTTPVDYAGCGIRPAMWVKK